MPTGPLDLRIGDIVELRKAHPCGGRQWRIVRVGIDIGIECLGCQHFVLVPRLRFETRVKRFISRVDSDEGEASPGTAT